MAAVGGMETSIIGGMWRRRGGGGRGLGGGGGEHELVGFILADVCAASAM